MKRLRGFVTCILLAASVVLAGNQVSSARVPTLIAIVNPSVFYVTYTGNTIHSIKVRVENYGPSGEVGCTVTFWGGNVRTVSASFTLSIQHMYYVVHQFVSPTIRSMNVLLPIGEVFVFANCRYV